MQANSDGFSIVLVGRWNPYIFAPDWIKANLRRNEETPVRVAIPALNVEGPRQISFDAVALYPSTSRLDIRPQEPTRENMLEGVETAKSILDLLHHTPVSAVGINYQFDETERPTSVTGKIHADDTTAIDATKYDLESTTVRRQYRKKDGAALNLTLVYDTKNVNIDFNFHHEVADAVAAQKYLDPDYAAACLDEALALIEEAYNLTLQQTTEEKDDA